MACLLIVKRLKYISDDGKLERKHCNVVGLNVKGNSKSLSFNSKGARHGCLVHISLPFTYLVMCVLSVNIG